MSTVRKIMHERLVESKKHILEVIKKNKVHLFKAPHKHLKATSSEKSPQFRDGNFNECFSHENQPCLPPCQIEVNSNWAPNLTLFDA